MVCLSVRQGNNRIYCSRDKEYFLQEEEEEEEVEGGGGDPPRREQQPGEQSRQAVKLVHGMNAPWNQSKNSFKCADCNHQLERERERERERENYDGLVGSWWKGESCHGLVGS